VRNFGGKEDLMQGACPRGTTKSWDKKKYGDLFCAAELKKGGISTLTEDVKQEGAKD